ncbi:LexA family transcriptional regulator [Chitinimonas sp. JJ19]|uniref:LexA family transcriptional regulator n=1 Tax=Chitinimonas sp. JJ19 TaxID=3109352 RepID=UPI0030027B7D
MRTLSERMQAAADAAKVSQADIARHLGVSRSTVNQWFNGRAHSLSADYGARAATFLNVNALWLSSGKGPMRPGEIPAGAAVAAYNDFTELDEQRYVKVPSYDVGLSAGNGNLAWVEHSEDDPLVFRASFFKARGRKPENAKALYVRGRSMEPELRDGDTVVIDIADTRIVDGEVYAVLVGDQLFIKFVDRLTDGIRLRSANPEFAAQDIRGEDLERFRVLGKKFWRAG